MKPGPEQRAAARKLRALGKKAARLYVDLTELDGLGDWRPHLQGARDALHRASTDMAKTADRADRFRTFEDFDAWDTAPTEQARRRRAELESALESDDEMTRLRARNALDRL